MGGLLLPVAFGFIAFVAAMNYFKVSTSLILGVLWFLLIYAHFFFNLSDAYIITVTVIFVVLLAITLIHINFFK